MRPEKILRSLAWRYQRSIIWMLNTRAAQGLEDAFYELSGRATAPATTAHLFRVLGMRRAGNHAVIGWLQNSIGGETLHINDIPPGRNGYRYRDLDPHCDAPQEHAGIMRAGRRRAFPALDGLICSYEDRTAASVLNGRRVDTTLMHYGPVANEKIVLIIRDPRNMFASRIKKGMIATIEQARAAKRLYIDHAETCLNEQDFPGLVCIAYNRWFSDREYRRAIQGRLGLEARDVSTETVSSYGGGSSFDGKALDGRAHEMNVLDRWQAFSEHPLFRDVFADGRLDRYAARLFPAA